MTDRLPDATLIDLLRHGEADGGHRFRGTTDDPTTNKGRQQMEAALAMAGPWEVILSSPMRRCAEVVQGWARREGLPLILDGRLREMNFGRWEGLAAAQVAARDGDALTRFWEDPGAYPPPDGESLAALHARVLAAWHSFARQLGNRHLLVVTHGGPIRVILGEVLGIPAKALQRLEVPLGGITRVRILPPAIGHSQFRLVFHGRIYRCGAASPSHCVS